MDCLLDIPALPKLDDPAIPVKVVFLNGPPGSGKDTAGDALVAAIPDSVVMKFAKRLKESVHADYGDGSLPHDHFEAVKNEPHEFFFGKTPRQAYIDKSERMMKPVFGEDIYGRIFCRDLAQAYGSGAKVVFITDSGFAAEARPVIDAIGGPKNALLIQLHAEARGKTFSRDSRSYLELPEVQTVFAFNNGSVEAFQEHIVDVVANWLDPKPPALLPEPKQSKVRRFIDQVTFLCLKVLYR